MRKVSDLMSEIKVSVCCLTYNHEKYIRQCLEGIIMQKTTFPFEVIIHDDASTDGTANIITEYAEKYPDMIKPILQTENQYSKNIPIDRTFIFPRIMGEYVAFCEGDDYWCDNQKLQKQVEFLDKHRDYSACVHNTRILNCKTGQERVKISNAVDEILPTELILNRSVKEFHTSSVVCRREFALPPEKLSLSFSGDYARALYLALSGKVFRLAKVMSVYRFFAEGSYTQRTVAEPKTVIINRNLEANKLHEAFDKYSNYQYHTLFQEKILSTNFRNLVLSGKYKEALNSYPEIVKKMTLRRKICLFIDAYIPIAGKVYRGLQNGRKNN